MRKILGSCQFYYNNFNSACGNKKEPPVLEDDLVVFDTQGGSVIDPVKYEESFLLQGQHFQKRRVCI